MSKLLKRKYQTLILLGTVAALFYLLQCISVLQLGRLGMSNNQEISDSDSGKTFEDANDDVVFRARNRVVDFHDKFNLEDMKDSEAQNIREENKKNKLELQESKNQNMDTKADAVKSSKLKGDINRKVKTNSLKHSDKSKNKSVSVLGVHPNDLHLYQADQQGFFTCFNSKQRIVFSRVNDDFCDCSDSSDEPGTSACPRSRFYCSTQLPGLPPQFLHSSKVNDGICDCCDGSDEWSGNQVPEYMLITEGERQGSVYHAPCKDRCQYILDVHKTEEDVRDKGRKLQGKYLQLALQDLSQAERNSYGPNGIFYLLSKNCYELKQDKYSYEVCPFNKVNQQAAHHSAVLLGSRPSVRLDKGQHLIEMTGGDDTLCPLGRSRVAKIYLLCGLDDKLLKVTETEVCEYTFTMTTPAAC